MGETEARPSIAEVIAELEEGFALFDEWEDRYRYLMELGRELAPPPPEEKVEDKHSSSFPSRVWLDWKSV
ncbi:MAG: SufE family protein, partial [Roseococcus sp.]